MFNSLEKSLCQEVPVKINLRDQAAFRYAADFKEPIWPFEKTDGNKNLFLWTQTGIEETHHRDKVLLKQMKDVVEMKRFLKANFTPQVTSIYEYLTRRKLKVSYQTLPIFPTCFCWCIFAYFSLLLHLVHFVLLPVSKKVL